MRLAGYPFIYDREVLAAYFDITRKYSVTVFDRYGGKQLVHFADADYMVIAVPVYIVYDVFRACDPAKAEPGERKSL